MSISTSNDGSDDEIFTLILVDFAIPRFTGSVVATPIIFKSENSLNPEGWMMDLTDSFQDEYGTSPLIEYENFW